MANKKGHPAWNKGLPKEQQPMFGKKHSQKTKKKISKTENGKILSIETKIKMGKSYVKTEKRLQAISKLGKSQRGEKSPNWKGGKSRAYKNGYYSIEYGEWREKVFERDNYLCQECFRQDKGYYITAHHIKSFAHYPELRYKLENGITLCEECHRKTDNYKGRNKGKKIQSRG